MFDVGFSELLIIAVVALLVLGPERLPKAARFAGLWVRRARAQWYSVKSELERELAAEEFKRQFTEPVQELRPQMERLGQDLKQEFDGLDPKLPARMDLAVEPPGTAADAAAPVAGIAPDARGEAPDAASPWAIPEVAETAGEPAPSVPEAADAPDEPTTGDLFGDGARRP
jgi:sec-independent protein translocase protein TatB